MAISLLNEVVECIQNNCGWDQDVFTLISWKRLCCFEDDNDIRDNDKGTQHTESMSICDMEMGAEEECLRMRILNAYYFPTS